MLLGRDQLLALHAEITLVDRVRLVTAHRYGAAVLEVDQHRARVEAEPAIRRAGFPVHTANSRTSDRDHADPLPIMVRLRGNRYRMLTRMMFHQEGSMEMGLAGRTVIVTGASSSIGRGILLAFAAEGAPRS